MTENKLLVVGNSVSQVPSENETVEPYPDLLEEGLPDWRVLREIHGGETVEELEERAAPRIRDEQPDATVLQTGIVDSAPRPLKRWERRLLGRVRPERLKRLVIGFLHDYRPQIIRFRGPNQFTPVEDFEPALRRLVRTALDHGSGVVVLPITHVTERMEERQPRYNEHIQRYNEAIQSLDADQIWTPTVDEIMGGLEAPEYVVDPESVHLGQEGHRRIADVLQSLLPDLALPSGSPRNEERVAR